MLRPNLADERFVDNWLTQTIDRFRILFFGFLVLLYVICFNGHWRPGHDSAIYRGLGSSLATGNGFVFGEWATQQAYPGLPLLLGGIERLFHVPIDQLREEGARAFIDHRIDTVVSVLVIGFMSLLTLVFTYKLIRLYYPRWMAVCVTFGVGINSCFVQLSHELLTDVPFLLGIVLALYGWELLQRAEAFRGGAGAVALIVAGLVLAGSMRPMFWVVGVAWILVCTWALVRGNRRRFHAVSLFVLVVTWSMLIVFDPRHPPGFHPLSGGYERELIEILPEAPTNVAHHLYDALRNELPAAFFGEQLSPLSVPASILVLGSCLLLFRRHPLWAWMVFIAFAITLIASTTSRYYVMVLPMLLLGWLLMLVGLARRLPPQWGQIALFSGLGLVTVNNLSATVGFVREQRSIPFIEHYKRGRYVQLFKMCDVIRTRVGDDERVLGPLAPVMSYVTGKTVLSQREVLPRGVGVLNFPRAIFDARLNYAIFPASVYRTKDPFIARLMERNIIFPFKRIAWADTWYLARVRIRVPQVSDWRELPKGWEPPPPAPKPPKKKPPATKPAAKKPAAKRPVTRPATQPLGHR